MVMEEMHRAMHDELLSAALTVPAHRSTPFHLLPPPLLPLHLDGQVNPETNTIAWGVATQTAAHDTRDLAHAQLHAHATWGTLKGELKAKAAFKRHPAGASVSSIANTAAEIEAAAHNQTEEKAQLLAELAETSADLLASRAREFEAAKALENSAASHQSQIAHLESQMHEAMMLADKHQAEIVSGLPADEVSRMRLKIAALSENYIKVKKSNALLHSDLEAAVLRVDRAKAETSEVQEGWAKDKMINQEAVYMNVCVQLSKTQQAYQQSVEKGAALTSATLDQAAEIFRLNELTRRLFNENTELVSRLRAVQNTQARGVWVPAM